MIKKKERFDWEKEKRIDSKVDFVRAILDAVLNAATESPEASLYYRVRHAVQHIEGYPGGFEEAIPDDARKRLIKIVEKFYQLYEDEKVSQAMIRSTKRKEKDNAKI